jgi:hypothetical protein
VIRVVRHRGDQVGVGTAHGHCSSAGCAGAALRTGPAARLPRRVRLPSQPPRYPDGRLPDPSRARCDRRSDDL